MRQLAAIEHELALISRTARQDPSAAMIAITRVLDDLDANEDTLWARYSPEAVNHVKAAAVAVNNTIAEIHEAQMQLVSVRLRTEGSALPTSTARPSHLQPPRPAARQRGAARRATARPRGRARCRTQREPATSDDPHLAARLDGPPRTALREGFERALAAAERWRRTAVDYRDLLESALQDLENACTDLAELRQQIASDA